MTLFHQFQDVYFDVIGLAEALAQLPESCECGDAEAHFTGRCRCVGAESEKPPGEGEPGCVCHLKKLRERLYWLEEDLQRVKIPQRAGEEWQQWREKSFLLLTCLRSLTASLDQLDQAIEQFRQSSADEPLHRLRACGQELRAWAEKLNALL
ncbi:hypothetical protein HRbin10_00895 [bacterium HR10]|nr:hypothetical protein HRbin10_00895 [bacterium HR10]